MPMSIYCNIPKEPSNEANELLETFKDDSNSNRVYLSMGTYRTDDGQPWVLPVVRKTESQIASDKLMNHEYLPVTGLPAFTRAATELLLGIKSIAISEKRAFGIQTLSGTGALRLAADFLHKKMKRHTVYYSSPSWEAHHKIFADAGFTRLLGYRYWDQAERQLDLKGMLADLDKAPPWSVIILHTCAHNPTGMDPTKEQWAKIADLMEQKMLFPLFDTAYQGFASGDPELDAWSVRFFVERGFELFAAQSFAKNFGLYGERVGNLTVVQQSGATMESIRSQMTQIIAAQYSNPPAYGARIVAKVLTTPSLRQDWLDCLKIMSNRIREMRYHLRDKLRSHNTPGNWEHLVKQIGMYSYTGLNPSQVAELQTVYHVYMLKSGRITLAGLNTGNIDYVAEAINAVVGYSTSKY